jgi:ubiquinone biosynthesis monooxygenase Coq7
MNNRRYSLIDRLVSDLDQALRTVLPPGKTASTHPGSTFEDLEMGEREKRLSAGLMRVNNAGEVSAQALYRGQALVSRDDRVRRTLEQAAQEEYQHLDWCNQRLGELDSMPSRLTPLWYGGSYAIGLLAGMAGDPWSLGFVSETERQVIRHLEGHLERLAPQDRRSRGILLQMQSDEERHGEAARQAGGRDLPLPARLLMRVTSKVMTSVAYYV